jgi:hypothetical protein
LVEKGINPNIEHHKNGGEKEWFIIPIKFIKWVSIVFVIYIELINI